METGKMKVDFSIDNGNAILSLEGRLDTNAVPQATDDVFRLLDEQQSIKDLVCDIKDVTYISSSGLRMLLHLAKQYPDFHIVGAQPEVYQVLDLTGFTKMMKVERALRKLDVKGCDVIGKGGVGVVYRLDDDTIIKVFREGSTMREVQAEIIMAKEAFVLGMPTAISFDVVQVGNRYGLVYELLKADTLSACIKREPERMEEFARLYAGIFRQLHAIQVPQNGLIPSAMEREECAVRRISRYFDTASVDLLLRIVQKIPVANRLLHCDLQTKNAMMGGDELMLIDLGEIGYGHPILDLGHAYSSMVSLLGDYEEVIGIPRDYGIRFWKRMLPYYFEGESPEMIAHRESQMEVVGTVRNFSWLSLSDSFPETLIRECQQAFNERVTKRKDYLLDICDTFDDWVL